MTDKDAKPLQHKDGRILPSYNQQSAVDGKYGVVCSIQTRTRPDHPDDLLVLVEEAKKNSGKSFKNIMADCGFGNYRNYELLEKRKEEALEQGQEVEEFYVPDERYSAKLQKKYQNGAYDLEHFTKDESGTYYCTEGNPLPWKKQEKKNGTLLDVYKGTHCRECPKHDECTKGTYRTIKIDTRNRYQEAMRKKLYSDRGRKIYRKRQGIVEPVHGDDQKNRGWIQHHLRTLEKASGEFCLVRIATNLGKLVKYAGNEILKCSLIGIKAH